MSQIAVTAQEARAPYLIIAIAMASIFAIVTACIYYFYGLHGRATIYPYKTLSQQAIVILRVAVIVTLISLLPVWLSVRRQRKAGMEALTSALGDPKPKSCTSRNGAVAQLSRQAHGGLLGWFARVAFFLCADD